MSKVLKLAGYLWFDWEVLDSKIGPDIDNPE
jgi:hypothetical protein